VAVGLKEMSLRIIYMFHYTKNSGNKRNVIMENQENSGNFKSQN